MDPRHTYSGEETKLLVDLVEKHKLYILNKGSGAAVKRARDIAWSNIASVLNSKGAGPKREPLYYKTKWEYLMDQAKKLPVVALEVEDEDYILLHNRIVKIMNESVILGSIEIPKELLKLASDTMATNGNQIHGIDVEENRDSVDDDDSNSAKKRKRKFRSRSLNFTPNEYSLLLKCLLPEIKIITNKHCDQETKQLKNSAWARVAYNYNKVSPIKRSVEMLKNKMRNAKFQGAEITEAMKNLMNTHEKDTVEEDSADTTLNNLNMLDRVDTTLNMLDRVDTTLNMDLELDDSCDNMDDSPSYQIPNDHDYDVGDGFNDDNFGAADDHDYGSRSDVNCESKADEPKTARKRYKKRSRSMNFTPEECKLLLKCVRPERDVILSKDCTTLALRMKNRAWARVVHNYNRQSYKKLCPIIRTKQMLHDKLRQLRKKRQMKMGFNLIHKNLQVEEHEADEVEQAIKVESLDPELEPNEDVLDHDSSPPRSPEKNNDYSNNFNNDDPLSLMLNYSSGNDSPVMESKRDSEKEIHPSEDKELMKLQVELYKYQLENAKLERKLLEKRIADESIESAVRLRGLEQKIADESIECALRVRAARLEAIAAARKLPPHHPALRYSSLEDRAQAYLKLFQSK